MLLIISASGKMAEKPPITNDAVRLNWTTLEDHMNMMDKLGITQSHQVMATINGL